jgi:hypothetical protein
MLGRNWKPENKLPFADEYIPFRIIVEPNKVIMDPDKRNIEFTKIILSQIEQVMYLDAIADKGYTEVIDHDEDYARGISISRKRKIYKDTGGDPELNLYMVLFLQMMIYLNLRKNEIEGYQLDLQFTYLLIEWKVKVRDETARRMSWDLIHPNNFRNYLQIFPKKLYQASDSDPEVMKSDKVLYSELIIAMNLFVYYANHVGIYVKNPGGSVSKRDIRLELITLNLNFYYYGLEWHNSGELW